VFEDSGSAHEVQRHEAAAASVTDVRESAGLVTDERGGRVSRILDG